MSFENAKVSFIKATKGEEDLKILIRYWGVIAYVLAYIFDKIILWAKSQVFGSILAAFCTIYFAWHLYAMIKCTPKKPKLSKEEKQKLRAEKRKEFFKSLTRKLLLQESFTKWDPVLIVKVLDLYCIANFFGMFLD